MSDRCLIGKALTVQTRAGDNLAIYDALTKAQPNDVLVVDGCGCLERALVGDLARAYAMQRGVVGFIIDGAVRDVSVFGDGQTFGCFARGASHRGPTKDGPGKVNIPVAIGDQVVSPGDIILADSDGVVSFPSARLHEIRKLVTERIAAEQEIRAEILTGKVRQSWIDAAFAKAGSKLS
jgi:regulator of RNase E activity RraA